MLLGTMPRNYLKNMGRLYGCLIVLADKLTEWSPKCTGPTSRYARGRAGFRGARQPAAHLWVYGMIFNGGKAEGPIEDGERSRGDRDDVTGERVPMLAGRATP